MDVQANSQADQRLNEKSYGADYVEQSAIQALQSADDGNLLPSLVHSLPARSPFGVEARGAAEQSVR
jgi:hypothetical protein